MALSKLELDTVSKGCQVAKRIIEELYPVLFELKSIYDSQGGAKSTIGQAGLDAVPSFSALTKQQLDDGMYPLTATICDAISNAFAQLSQLAARA
jgi:hypothetical protein